MELTLEQKRAVALARARLAVSASPPKPLGKPEELSFAEKNIAPLLEAVGIGAIPEAPVRGMVQGAADPVIGVAQAFAPSGSGMDTAIRDQLSKYEDSRGQDKGTMDGWRMAGSILGPLSMLTGGAGATTGALGRIGQGIGMGVVGGATNPVTGKPEDFWEDKGTQTAIGALLGGVLPGAWEGAKAGGRLIRNVVQPNLGKSGAVRSAGRLGRELAGDKTDDVIEALARSHGNETAGQATVGTGSAEFAALSDIAGSYKPTPRDALLDAQQAARADKIKAIAQTPEDLAAAKAARKSQAATNYSASGAVKMAPDEELASLLERPSMQSALKRAESLAKEAGEPFDLTSGQNMHYMKMAMDDLQSNPERFGIGATEVKAIGDTQRRFIDWIERNNEAYGKARSDFREASKPINQMVAGAELEKALTSGAGKERATAFTNKVRDITSIPELQRKTGANRFGSIEDVLTAKQMGDVKGVARELSRDVELEKKVASGMRKATSVVGDFGQPHPMSVLDRGVMIANAIVRRASGHGSKKTMDALAELNLQPGGLAEAMRNAKPYERSQIIDALMRMQAAGIGQAQ